MDWAEKEAVEVHRVYRNDEEKSGWNIWRMN
jgi:hypothetical protein